MRLIRSLALAGALSCVAPMALLAPQAVASSETEKGKKQKQKQR